MDESYRRHSRRSHPNLQLMSITPLTSLPLDVDPNTNGDSQPARKSYITSRSLPQTPSILSRSSSRSRSRLRLSSKSSHAIAELAMTTPFSPKPYKSPHHSRSQSTRLKPSDGTDWLLQTASALATSTAESKGQAWLATRSSSISLTDASHEPMEYAYRADDEFSPVFMRYPSRPHSRFGSRMTSRRGSKVGLMTPLGLRTPGEREEQAGYFDNLRVDFVDEDEDGDISEEDSEIKRLVWGRVGGWVDWAVGWMDLRADEEQHDMEEEDLGEVKEEAKQADGGEKRILERKRRKRQELYYEGTKDIGAVPPAPEGEGVIGDAAWLLVVAKSALL